MCHNKIIYFDSFRVKHILKIYYTKHILKGKSLLDYTNLFSPNESNEYKKNDKIILIYFQ